MCKHVSEPHLSIKPVFFILLSATGQSECSSPAFLQEQDIDMEVEEKAGSPDMWTDEADGGIFETSLRHTDTHKESEEHTLASEAEPGDVLSPSHRSDWGEEEACTECPKVEKENTTSVIVRVQGCGQKMADAVSVYANSELKKDETRSVNESVIVTSSDRPKVPSDAPRPRKVIVTNVTVNRLTVTFKEACCSEGFFNGC